MTGLGGHKIGEHGRASEYGSTRFRVVNAIRDRNAASIDFTSSGNDISLKIRGPSQQFDLLILVTKASA